VSVRVIAGGLQTTVQDLGRPSSQRQGVPAGGAMDRTALRAGNILVGNDEGAAGLEAALIGPTLAFDRPTLIAITGADLVATVEHEPLPAWHAALVQAGAVLRFGAPARGCRAYIALAGGLDVPLLFGSRSTYLRAEFGGLDGRALRAGDALNLGSPSALSREIAASLRATSQVSIARWSIGSTVRPRFADDALVRVIPGAHASALSDQSRDQLFAARFRVSASSDRMGYRLEGPPLSLASPIELLSEAVAFGTIQLPPGGAPIVLMADRQTTGGYPRIGEVASIDLPLVAQLKPGDHVRFRPISLRDAQRLYLAREQELAEARLAIALRFSRGKA
jgi:antagonist of KipI